jgi:hypothetical protein
MATKTKKSSKPTSAQRSLAVTSAERWGCAGSLAKGIKTA